MSHSKTSQTMGYKYLSRYVPKDLKYILGIINIGGGTIEIGGLNGDPGFKQIHKLQELIQKQLSEKEITPLISFNKLAIANNLFRIVLKISSSDIPILSKGQVPFFLGSHILFKAPSVAKEFKLWKENQDNIKLSTQLWDDFNEHQISNSIQFNQSQRKLVLQKSDDGSHTLFIPEMNETYHSTKGSRTEAEYVFLEKGIDFTRSYIQKTKLSILEIGFGTGLNAWLTLNKSIEQNINIDYQTLEPFPIPLETLEHLEFGFTSQADRKNWLDLHNLPWASSKQIHPNFGFQKFLEKLENIKTQTRFDLIFFDAFAPSKQPELWSLEVFQSCSNLLNSKGVLVSYCASSLFKKNLLLAGFKIEVLQGPPGKREMVRALKI